MSIPNKNIEMQNSRDPGNILAYYYYSKHVFTYPHVLINDAFWLVVMNYFHAKFT